MQTILIIEDELAVRESLQDLLEGEGFKTLGACNGSVGVQFAQEHRPDLILCDVNMPGLDGYDVLSTLHQHPETNTIPFIFLTAKGTKFDLRQGMQLGADDYLTKPCSTEELLGAIGSRFAKQSAIRARSEQQLATLRNNIALSLPHELQTPLNSILGFSDLLMQSEDIDRSEVIELAENIHSSATRLYRLVQNFLLYAQLEITASDPDRIAALRRGETPAPEELISAIATRVAKRHQREADIRFGLLQNAIVQISDIKLQKILEELLDNAFRFSEAETPVRVMGLLEEASYSIYIIDQGRGMTSNQITSLGAYMQFERHFYEQQGSGLGLIIAKRMLELHGGQLQIDSTPGEQTSIHITLPLAN